MAKVVTHQQLKSYLGDQDHLELSTQRSFSQLIFELLTEKSPSTEELAVFELILNLSIDHGSETPSAIKVIEHSQTGESLSQSVAEGIKQIGDTHGGAAKPLMEVLYQIIDNKLTIEDAINSFTSESKRVPGFGHRIYKELDPRAQLILEYTQKLPKGPSMIATIKEFEQTLNSLTQKQLPLNIDGAIAVAFCALNFDPKLGIAVFIIARTPGLIAHYLNNHPTN